MTERENCISIIDDNDFNKKEPIKANRTKTGYKVKYKRDIKFLGRDKTVDSEDIIGSAIFLTIFISLFTLLIISIWPWVPAWFIIPTLTFGLVLYFSINSKKSSIQDWLLSLYLFIVSISVTWGVLCVTYRGYFNDTEMQNYVREKVNPEWIFIKGE